MTYEHPSIVQNIKTELGNNNDLRLNRLNNGDKYCNSTTDPPKI